MSLEIEHRLIGSLVYEPSAVDRAADLLPLEAFPEGLYKRLYALIIEANERGVAWGLADIYQSITGHPEELQGPLKEALTSSTTEAFTTAFVEQDARELKEAYTRRKIENTFRGFQEQLDAGVEDIKSFIEAASRSILALEAEGLPGVALPMKNRLKAIVERLEAREANPGATFGATTPFKELNDLTTGFQPGNLIIVAARPSMGKTAFALNLAAHQALVAKKPCLFFSLEMTRDEVDERLLVAEAQVNGMDVKKGLMDWEPLMEAAHKFKDGANLYVDDTSSISPSAIRSVARRINRECGGLSLIIVDYIQIMGNDSRRGDSSREQEVSLLSRSLKALAKELNVPIVALSQLNRAVEGRQSKKPLLSDLRESGAIEQDADVVMLLYRADYYQESDDNDGWAEINVAKHRNGPTGTISLKFLKESAKFVSGVF